VLVAAVLALGLGGVALAQRSATPTQVSVTLNDKGLIVKPTSFPAGKVTLVVTNRGKLTHALSIMGKGLAPHKTATIATGKSATLSVTVGEGMFHLWDSLRSSMSHATYVEAKASTASSSSGGAVSSSGSSTSTGSSSVSGGTKSNIGTSGSGATSVPGMDGCEHM